MAKLQATVRLDKDQLVRARKALGAETVTEIIEWALALAPRRLPTTPSSGSTVAWAGRTPLPTANLAVLDTSVYIENFRTGRFTLVLRGLLGARLARGINRAYPEPR